jgi:hypothetical protein
VISGVWEKDGMLTFLKLKREIFPHSIWKLTSVLKIISAPVGCELHVV